VTAPPRHAGGGGIAHGDAALFPRLHFLAEHRAGGLGKRETARREDPPGLRRDDQRPGAALAKLDVGEFELAPKLVADANVAVEGEGRAGIHAPRHRDARQHAALGGGAVFPQRGAPGIGMQETEMPARRDRLAGRRHFVRTVEGGDHGPQGRLGDDILILDLAAEFLLQRFDVDGHGTSSRSRQSLLNHPP
jgi:hypothetical protein